MYPKEENVKIRAYYLWLNGNGNDMIKNYYQALNEERWILLNKMLEDKIISLMKKQEEKIIFLRKNYNLFVEKQLNKKAYQYLRKFMISHFIKDTIDE
jgi:hypothetical protein